MTTPRFHDDTRGGPRPDPQRALLEWLIEQALPLWTRVGVDRAAGGFFEQIDLGGAPVHAPRRTRVVARQIYVFATAARRGWAEDAQACVDHGLRFLLGQARRPDGTFASSVTPGGAVVDARFDLYEQAFALFALASARRDRPDRESLRGEAEQLLAALQERWAHPDSGFEESTPRTLPLRANPHMHLLEAALEWAAISTGRQAEPWWQLADQLVTLCLTRLIDPASGAVRENFGGDWRPLPDPSGGLVEPGHQFEWAWLLLRWARARHPGHARATALRLIEIGEGNGVDRSRNVAVNALHDPGWAVTDPAAKIWPQTERIKAWHQALVEAVDPAGAARARDRLDASMDSLRRYLLPAPPGLWEEVMLVDGRFAPQASRASSLYHIVCAIDTVHGEPGRP